MTRIIVLAAPEALGLSDAPVHEPVHACGQAIPIAVTQRDDKDPPYDPQGHLARRRLRLICMAWPYRSSLQGVESGAGGSRLGRPGQPAATPAASKRHLTRSGDKFNQSCIKLSALTETGEMARQ